MRTVFIILLSGLLLCGCTHKQASSEHGAINHVEPGKDVTWTGGYTLYVAKRNGSSIQGIRLVRRGPDGHETTFIADIGTVAPGLDQSSIRVILYNVKSESAKTQTTIEEFTINLQM